jgi:predicted metal-dependent hydrolase
MARAIKHLIYNYNGHNLPVKVHFERRRSSRIALGKTDILLRVPWLCRGPLLDQQLLWMDQWLTNTFSKKPAQFHRLLKANVQYVNGQQIQLFDRTISLSIKNESRKTTTGRLNGSTNTLDLIVPQNVDRQQVSNAISRALAQYYRSHFEEMVHHYNDNHFHKKISGIRLKNNSSNWGSCSSNGIINLSTRLLLVPLPAQRYVVVHELAHLLELNHSHRFWALVEKVMPDYSKYDRWLSKHASDKVI